jgi:hypothetical protein
VEAPARSSTAISVLQAALSWELSAALGVNNEGKLVGQGTYQGSLMTAFLLGPAPRW